MGIVDRFAGALSGVASRVETIARTIRGPEQSRIADVPGVPHYGTQPTKTQAERVLESWGVYSSRVAPEAGPTRTRWALWTADNLTPETIINAQREAVTSGIPLRWVELLDQIYSRDGHYASCTDQRVSDVIKGTWRLTPAWEDDAGIAASNFVETAYRQTSRWTDGLGWLLKSNFYSYNSVEAEWYREPRFTFPGPKGETIGPFEAALPKRLHNVHPKHFRFDLESDDPLFYIGDGYQPLPIGKFIFLDGGGGHPVKLRNGHAWQCVWYSLFRSISWASWATRVERFDMPIPILGYDGDLAQYAEYQTAMSDILNAMGSGKGIRYPKNNFSFEIKDPPRGGTSNDPQSALSDACDAAQSIRVLGGQLNNKIGNVGSFAASSNHLDIKYGIEELDASRMWERLDEQLSDPILRFNAVGIAEALNAAGYSVTPDQITRRVPKGKHHIPGKTDPEAEMRVIKEMVDMGMPVSMAGTFSRSDVIRARDENDRIPGKAVAVAKGGALVTTGEAADDPVKNPDEAANAKAVADVSETQDAKRAPDGGEAQLTPTPPSADGE